MFESKAYKQAMKDEEQERKTRAVLKNYGMEGFTGKDAEAVREIARSMSGNSIVALGAGLSGNGTDSAKLGYLNAIVQQNFIMIRQLERILKAVEK